MSASRFVLVLGAFALGSVVTLAATFTLLALSNSSSASVLPAQMNTQAAPVTEDYITGKSDGLSNDIKVHGRWTVEVREPDGGVASHTEFQNDLTSFGKVTLAEILARERLPFYWKIWTSGDAACLRDDGSGTACYIFEPLSTRDDNYVFRTLEVSATDDGELILEGTATAQRDGTISRVSTVYYSIPCTQAEYPDDCPSILQNQLITRATLPSAVDVAEGQQVLIAVEITFE